LAGGDITDSFDRHWRLWVLIFWLGAAAYMLFDRWGAILGFGLSDTDDNMRIMQVRALLAGQGWFDLRQYRLDPPFGADIHWSRLVDLPIAGIMLVLRPLTGGQLAEKIAVAVAPLLPMAVAMTAIAVIARRLIAPKAVLLALAILLVAHSARLMWAPLRIDHHGWQLAFLSVVVAGLADRNRVRGGLMTGLATAASLAIGLEMLIYLALAGAALVLFWIRDGAEAKRLAAYGASLAGGCVVGFLVFASYANRAPVCDALSPVWLSATLAAGALCVGLALVSAQQPLARFGLAATGGLVLAAAFAFSWPTCLGRFEGVSPEAQRLWLDHVREARPLYRQSWNVIVSFAILPILGLVGYAAMAWRSRREPELLQAWAAIGLLALTGAALLLWQTRAGPASQLLAVPGAAGIAWITIIAIRASPNMLVRVFGTVAAFFIISGIGPQYLAGAVLKGDDKGPRQKSINRANRLCPTLASLHPIALLPKGYVLTFVDLAPRLITVTHHDAVTGPYHRNDAAIVDVMHAFRGDAENAHRMIARRGIDYVLICPNMSESTNYSVQAPKGFYVQLTNGKAPDWLDRIPLPSNSPYLMWSVKR
jgi:hypothetical protein